MQESQYSILRPQNYSNQDNVGTGGGTKTNINITKESPEIDQKVHPTGFLKVVQKTVKWRKNNLFYKRC